MPAWPLRGPAARRRTVGVGLASKAPSDRQALRLLAEHVAEALAGAAPPWQVPARLDRVGGCSDGRMLLNRVKTEGWLTKALNAVLIRRAKSSPGCGRSGAASTAASTWMRTAATCASVPRLAASVDGSASMSVDGLAEEAEAQATGLGKSRGCSVWVVSGGFAGGARGVMHGP